MSDRVTDEKQKKSTIRPAFTLYHGNQKGTGSALALRVFPSMVNQPGYVQLEIARQQTVGDFERRVFPTFNWKERIMTRLTPLEVGEIIEVFRGMKTCVRDGEGFSHRTDGRSSKINLIHVVEPRNCFQMQVFQDTIEGEDKELTIYLSPSEAFTLEMGLSASMGRLCFGG